MGTLPRTLPACLLVLLLGAAPAAAAAEYVPYSDLRRDNPVIDETIALLSSSDLHGTLNRISALFTRGQVSDLPDGTLDSELPENVRRNLQNALEDLGADLLAADADLAASGLTGDDLLRRQWVLVQVVNLVFSERMLELSYVDDGGGVVTCGTSEFDVQCPYTASEATGTLDAFLDQLIREPSFPYDPLPLQRWLNDVLYQAEQEDGFDEFSSVGLDPRDFSPRVQRLQTTAPVIEGNAVVHGEPIIDL